MNVELLAHLPAPVRRGLYFGSQRLIGSRVYDRWREFKRWQRLAAPELDAKVDARLGSLISHAVACSEYYRELGITPAAGESPRETLSRFPILDRQTLQREFSRLVIDSHRQEITGPASLSRRRYDWLAVKTGGTTGAPTTVVHDANLRDWGRASRLIAQEMCGFPLGAPYFRLWGSEQDLLAQKEKFDRRVMRALLAETPMNAFRAKGAELRQHAETMSSHPQVAHLMTYADAAVGLATFIQEQHLRRPRLKTVMSTSGTLLPEWRQLLQEVFGADVFDKYGSRECTEIASECAHHTGLHIFSPQVYVEVVDEHGQGCAPGQTGRILVTLLNNAVFPMIRYEIGDLGILSEPGPCPCGLPFPRLKSIEGRKDDALITQEGTLLTSGFVRHFVGVSLNRQLIKEWQFEQTGPTSFVFRYIPLSREGLAENLSRICESFRLTLGQATDVRLEEVPEIPVTATGKVRWIINSFRAGRDEQARSTGLKQP